MSGPPIALEDLHALVLDLQAKNEALTAEVQTLREQALGDGAVTVEADDDAVCWRVGGVVAMRLDAAGLAVLTPLRARGRPEGVSGDYGGFDVFANGTVGMGTATENPSFKFSRNAVLLWPGEAELLDVTNDSDGDNAAKTIVMREGGLQGEGSGEFGSNVRNLELLGWFGLKTGMSLNGVAGADNPHGLVRGVLDIGGSTEYARYHPDGRYANEIALLRIMSQGTGQFAGASMGKPVNTMFVMGGAQGAEFYQAWLDTSGGVVNAALRGDGSLGVGGVPWSRLTVNQSSNTDTGGLWVVEAGVFGPTAKRAAVYVDGNGSAYFHAIRPGVNDAYVRVSPDPHDATVTYLAPNGHDGPLCVFGDRSYGWRGMIAANGAYWIDGRQVMGPRQPNVPDATSSDDVVQRLNELLARARASGWLGG